MKSRLLKQWQMVTLRAHAMLYATHTGSEEVPIAQTNADGGPLLHDVRHAHRDLSTHASRLLKQWQMVDHYWFVINEKDAQQACCTPRTRGRMKSPLLKQKAMVDHYWFVINEKDAQQAFCMPRTRGRMKSRLLKQWPIVDH
ncbi:hypothetical protein DPMN_032685 [Dreissena polymorpha]|uniref:Uncharacterized protein n=1 Tax=Dreissena polymorpha TaxID=45954 RepID=A0A9D4M730_DREPO|nr:hypothetical protein DPMN_032685 [Dreissena polymorpha]